MAPARPARAARQAELHPRRGGLRAGRARYLARRRGRRPPISRRAGDFVVKPRFSCCGHRCAHPRRGAVAIPADRPPAACLVQAFVAGSGGAAHSPWRIRAGCRSPRSIAARSSPARSPWRSSASTAPAVERLGRGVRRPGKLERLALVRLRASLRMAAPFAFECNPRMTSGVHFVHPDDLAPAIADPATMPAVRLREQRQLQQFFPCLTATQGSLFRRQPVPPQPRLAPAQP